MTTRLVLLQGGLSPAPATLSAGAASPKTAERATEKNSGWVVPRPQRWTTPYSKPSERAHSPTTAHRLRDDPSAADCAFLKDESCSACHAGHPSSCLSLGIREPGITALGIRDSELSQAHDGGDPPDCA